MSVNITGRLQVLYTDYNFALMYACAVESPSNGRCPRDQSRVVVYGRRKWNTARLPDDVREFLEPVANDACLYLEDFVPATLPPGYKLFSYNHLVTITSFGFSLTGSLFQVRLDRNLCELLN